MITARENPLRMERLELIAFRFQAGNWQQHLDRLQDLDFRAAIVGKHGRGKSTLLRELGRRLPDSHLLNLPHDKSQHDGLIDLALQAANEGRVVLVDGIERVNWWQRTRLYRRTSAGLVVTVHRPCRLPTWIQLESSPELIRELVDELGLGADEILTASEHALAHHTGNIRDALRSMYDDIAVGRLAMP